MHLESSELEACRGHISSTQGQELPAIVHSASLSSRAPLAVSLCSGADESLKKSNQLLYSTKDQTN